MKPDVLLTRTIKSEPITSLDQGFTVHRYWEAPDPGAFLAGLADRIRGLVTSGDVGADAELIRALPGLEIIACFGVGVDAIDLEAARAQGVIVTNTPDVLTDDVADLAMGLIVAIAREIPRCDRFVRAGLWEAGPMPYGTRVSGKKVGILGLGRIGRAFAKRAEAFDLTVLYHGPRKKSDVSYAFYPDLEAMAAECDFLVLTCPGGETTRHIVNTPILEALGARGYLINVSRGSTVDEQALIMALREGTIAGAALDVYADEPRVPAELWALENVVLLPHVGSATWDTRNAMGQRVVDNLEAYFAGKQVLTRVA